MEAMQREQPMRLQYDASEQAFIEQAKRIEAVLQRAVRHALLQHKRAGNPVAASQNGRLCIIAPERIQVAEDGVEVTGVAE